MSGLCQCGCGRSTNVRPHSRPGFKAGTPYRFLRGHATRGRTNRTNWKGGRHLENGYVCIWLPDHPRANNRYVHEHIVVAEKVLGRSLPPAAVVHHANEIKSDNRPCNLVICQDRAYHNLLHRRLNALKASGNPDWRRCSYCKTWDDPARLVTRVIGGSYHKACSNAHRKLRHQYRPWPVDKAITLIALKRKQL